MLFDPAKRSTARGYLLVVALVCHLLLCISPRGALADGGLTYKTCSLSPDTVCTDMTCGAVSVNAVDYSNIDATECECGLENLGHVFGPCLDNNMRAVVYYWKPPAICLNATLPPPAFVPCEGCSAGHYIDTTKGSCQPCPAGTSWDGVGVRTFDSWDSLPMGFHSYCAALPGAACSSWALMGDTIQSGDNYNNHYMESILTLRVNIVKPGWISFYYRVSSESGRDGLMFGDSNLFLLGISNTDWTEYSYALTVGWHQLDWIYTKDYWGSAGEDKAYISRISIAGTEQDPVYCPPCPPGTYSSLSGSTSCASCGDGQISNKPYGSTGCATCGEGKYSYPGSDYCIPVPACTEEDYVTFTTPCVGGTRTKEMRLITPAACNETESTVVIPEDVPESCTVQCNPGQQPSGHGCTYCNGDSYSTNGITCSKCSSGSAATPKSIIYNYWDVLPAEMTTNCSGSNCRTNGWRAAYNYIDSGVGHGPSVQSWLQTTVQMPQGGSISYNLTLDCESSNLDGIYLSVNDSLYTVHKCAGCEETPTVYSLDLPIGIHVVSWSYNKFTEPRLRCDRALLSTVTVLGSTNGGAATCTACPKNTYSTEIGCQSCPAGYTSKREATVCSKCPANTISESGGDCYPCGLNTVSKSGDSSCSFNCSSLGIRINKGRGVMKVWDLGQYNTKKMLGPVLFPQDQDKEFYFSFCKPNTDSCVGDNVDDPIQTNVCLKERYTMPDTLNATTTTTVKALGKVASFASIDYPMIGLQVNFTNGERNCQTQISMICDPLVTDAMPELISFVDDESTCSYQFKWLTSVGCPLCDPTDWAVTTSACEAGKQTSTYFLKIPNSCRDGFTPKDQRVACHDITLGHGTLWVIVSATIGGVFFFLVATFFAYRLYRKNRELEVKYTQLKDQMGNNELVDADMLSVQDRGTTSVGNVQEEETEMQTISVD